MNRPAKAVDLEIRTAGKDVLVHDRTHGKIHVLNATAARVLELCDGTRTAGDIAAVVGRAAADTASVLRDVTAALDEFEKLQLVS